MHSHRILVSALFINMSSHNFPLLFQRNILLSLASFSVCTLPDIYIFLNVALVVVVIVVVVVIAVAVVESAVGSVELQRERERDSLSAV